MDTEKRYIGKQLDAKSMAEKNTSIKQLRRDFPDVPELWLDMLYDWVSDNPIEAERIMVSGEWERESIFSTASNKKYIDTLNARSVDSKLLH